MLKLHRLSFAAFAPFFLGSAGPALNAQLGPVGAQFWSQSSAGVGVATESDAYFGYALAAADFDCDGFDDLAIGMPGEDLTAAVDGGRVLVLYSTETGPAATGNQVWGQHSPVIEDEAEAGDNFGEVLAAGDFDGDGCADLAVGVPDEGVGDTSDAGAVNVLYGGADGLSGDNDDFWHQGNLADSVAEPFDRFGAALAVGDFDADGFDDLAVGVPFENIGEVVDAGALQVLWGSASGLSGQGSLTLFRGSGFNGTPQAGEQLGTVLAAADFVPLFPGDDLAVGVPWLDVDGIEQAGGVVLISDLAGSVFDTTWHADSPGVPGIAEEFDRFGAALSGGDFDGDGLAELAVGIPQEAVGDPSLGAAGAVVVLDFDGDGMQLWLQDDLAPEQSETLDGFGSQLAAGDFDADGIDDLAVGVSEEDLGGLLDAGLIHVLYGEPGSGLGASRDQIWIQSINPSEAGDQYGFSLAAGNFAGHSGADLAVGAPFVTIGGFTSTGGVSVLFSEALFADGFEAGLAPWSAVVP
jgi:hypothetical protein